jgi:hypothetical protein
LWRSSTYQGTRAWNGFDPTNYVMIRAKSSSFDLKSIQPGTC